MKILPPEQDIKLYEEGFEAHDILGRKKVGQALSSLVNRISDPVVIALDGKWGTGKTHFLKRWVGAHTLENDGTVNVVYFDAFAQDYLNDPLPALISSLSERFLDNDDKFKTVKAIAFKLAKPLARITLAAATFGATKALGAFGDEVVEAASSEATDALDKYWKEETGRREAIVEFRDAMKALAAPNSEENIGASLIFVIDELDRCRPDYALEVLEVIKHFFSVPHVHFILGVNLEALEHIVCARYGGEINAHGYLKKFIQLTLELPAKIEGNQSSQAANLIYLDDLMKIMEFPDHIKTPLKKEVDLISLSNHVSLRDINKIVSSIALTLIHEDVSNSKKVNDVRIAIMIDLIISKIIRPDFYEDFLNARSDALHFSEYYDVSIGGVMRTSSLNNNQRYKDAVSQKYLTWQYITSGGNPKNVNKGKRNEIRDKFGPDDLDSITAKELPRKIHTEWINPLKLYS